MSARTVLAAVVLIAGATRAASGQVVPNAHWRTIHTTHFDIHFTPALESTARRAAVDAEHAYTQLAAHLHPPRGPIDLVVADNVDISNGFTTPFPTNRIVIFARPPLDVPSLRYYDDWIQLVITHELTHAFHLDRAGGWWGIAQDVFGRAPFLFPNLYDPGWIAEGLATFYESDLTGAGRVEGTYEPMVVNATVADGGLPPYDRWNLATTRFPGGDLAYGFGSLFLDYLARTRGPATIGQFVEQSSRAPIPFRFNHNARRAFGISFADAWREWRDSLDAHRPLADRPLDGWRDLSPGGYFALYPRWTDSASLVYSCYDWKSSPGVCRASLAGGVHRLGRRNGTDANTPLATGSLLFSQLDYTDPYHIRSDLYIARDGHTRRLTRGARLAEADARADGAIIAVRVAPATTQLVRVSADGRTITPITSVSPDTEWAEPRWSPQGDRIAVTRWTRGGYADVVVLDTLGHLLRAITHDRAFDSTPSWSADGSEILFTSDRTGVAEIYIAPAAGDEPPRRISHATLGAFYPTMSRDGTRLAAVRYDARGWHVGVAPFDTAHADTPPIAAEFDSAPPPPPAASDPSPAHPYSPWRTLVPHYWLPLIGQTVRGSYSFGAATSGSDIIGRHFYFAQLLLDPVYGEHAFDAVYRYAGLGEPLIDVSASQAWDRGTVVDTTGAPVGNLLRRSRTAVLDFTVTRPRYRSSAFALVGAELEMRQYTTAPGSLLDQLNSYYRSNPRYWTLVASAGWSDAQRPPLSISLEDGVSIAATGRIEWLDGASAVQSQSLSAVLSGYKSLDIGGYAHHVIAVSLAGGAASGADPGQYDVGGSSGTPVALFPGITIGSHHTFAVRGFPSGAQTGTRVLTGTLEYRAPLFAPHRGLGFWPAFLDRVSVAAFTDAGTAWGPWVHDPANYVLASTGAELDLDTGLEYDIPYHLRLGVAAPVVNHALVKTSPVSVYFQLGFQF